MMTGPNHLFALDVPCDGIQDDLLHLLLPSLLPDLVIESMFQITPLKYLTNVNVSIRRSWTDVTDSIG